MYANTAEAQIVVDKMQSYGVVATGEVVTGEYHSQVDYADQMTLAEVAARGGKVTRVRLLTEVWGPGVRMADVSYMHATLPDGKIVPLYVGIDSGALYGPKGVKARMIEWAKSEGVYAKGLGLLDEENWSVLH